MKAFIFFLFIFFIGCTFTKQQKAERIVMKYLDTVLNDPASYKSVSFEKVDTLFGSVDKDSTYIAMSDRLDSLKKLSEDINDKIDNANTFKEITDIQRRITNVYAQQTKLIKERLNYSLGFKGKPIGWVVTHKYRAKNGFGALTIHVSKFMLDSALTRVESTEEL